MEPAEGGREELERKLRGACAESDIVSILRYLAQGCDINHYVGDPADKQTLLHHVVREGVASSFTVELLTQNGAKIYAMDAKGVLLVRCPLLSLHVADVIARFVPCCTPRCLSLCSHDILTCLLLVNRDRVLVPCCSLACGPARVVALRRSLGTVVCDP